MRLTEKQAIILFDIAKYAMSFVGGVGGYDRATISKTVDQILNQQSDELIELDRSKDASQDTTKEGNRNSDRRWFHRHGTFNKLKSPLSGV
jgi:hypothetical protein